MSRSLIGAIDQSTTSTKFQVFDLQGQLIIKEQIEHEQIIIQVGWLEHNPNTILDNLYRVLQQGADALVKNNYNPQDILTIGLTNQRETTIAWNKLSGQPYMNAIVWNDSRTNSICQRFIQQSNGNKNYYKQFNGLPINTYFSAFKIKWMMENCEPLRVDLKDKPNEILFGTMDSWILWNLIGKKHLTDVTNASRTFLMNLSSLQWDQQILEAFKIPLSSLAHILPSGSEFGTLISGPFKSCTINSVLGDQMAAAVGHGIFKEGESKNTYGTGLFLLANIGENLRIVDDGLLTSVLYQKDSKSRPTYAFEGAIECGGSTINWARDKMNLFQDYQELNDLVESVSNTEGVYFVPAFSGLYSPHWNQDASGTIIGLSLLSSKQHILRALYESMCYRTKDVSEYKHIQVIKTMEEAGQIKINFLNVDGGLSQSQVLMQMQADILQKKLIKPLITDSTCLGVALYAAYAKGIIKSEEEISAILRTEKEFIYDNTKQIQVQNQYVKWQKAVKRSLDWYD